VSALGGLLAGKRVVVCVGPGGVGKTSVAAAVALRAAVEGRRSLVVTFDPSRRLATSLGLGRLENAPAPLPAERLRAAGLAPAGELSAMHLDVKRTFDELIRRRAPSPADAERILANRLYRSLSTVLAGTHEYMAMEKLYELSREPGYDLLVLDTPPASAALDLLEAPRRILEVFGQDALGWIADPAVAAGRGGGLLVRHLGRLTGGATLQALAELLLALQGLYDGFRERAAAVQALLAAPETTFVLVTTPDPLGAEEALRFYGVLRLHEVAVDAVVVNRVQPDWRAAAGGADLGAAALAAACGEPLAERLAATVAEQGVLAAAHAGAVARLADYLDPGTRLELVPTLADDPHDLAALGRIGGYLFDRRGDVPGPALPRQ